MQPLTDADLERIFEKYIKGKHRVNCNEFHAHGYDCVEFEDEQTMLMDRLRVEILILRGKLKDIAKIAKE